MNKTQEALKLALEALELHAKQYPHMQKGYTVDAIEALRSALAQQGEQPEERIRLTDGEWPIIELGFGKVEVAEGWQGEVPALIFGRNGTGNIGEPTQPDRVHLAGETLAVVTFANVESLDVVTGKLATIRAERFAAAPAAQPTCKQDLQVPTVKKSLHVATGWAAPKDQYAVPVLFNPYSGEPRDVRDVQSDPQGVLIVPPGKVEMLASKGRSCKVGSGCVAGESSQCACSELNPPAAPAAQPDTWTGDGWTWLQALVFLVLISPFLFLIFWSTK